MSRQTLTLASSSVARPEEGKSVMGGGWFSPDTCRQRDWPDISVVLAGHLQARGAAGHKSLELP